MKKADNKGSGEAIHIGLAINELLNAYHLRSKFDEANLIASWERLVGKPVTRRTKKVFIKNKVLFVQLESPAMKHDLNLHKSQIMELFKKEFGADIVKEIVLM